MIGINGGGGVGSVRGTGDTAATIAALRRAAQSGCEAISQRVQIAKLRHQMRIGSGPTAAALVLAGGQGGRGRYRLRAEGRAAGSLPRRLLKVLICARRVPGPCATLGRRCNGRYFPSARGRLPSPLGLTCCGRIRGQPSPCSSLPGHDSPSPTHERLHHPGAFCSLRALSARAHAHPPTAAFSYASPAVWKRPRLPTHGSLYESCLSASHRCAGHLPVA